MALLSDTEARDWMTRANEAEAEVERLRRSLAAAEVRIAAEVEANPDAYQRGYDKGVWDSGARERRADRASDYY